MNSITLTQYELVPVLSQLPNKFTGNEYWIYRTTWWYRHGNYDVDNTWNKTNNKFRLISYSNVGEIIIQDRFTKRYYKGNHSFSNCQVNPTITLFHIQYPIPFIWMIPGRCKGSIDNYPIFHDITVIWLQSGVEKDITFKEFEELKQSIGYD